MNHLPLYDDNVKKSIELQLAILSKKTEKVDELLDNNCEIDVYALMCAVFVGNVQLVERFINPNKTSIQPKRSNDILYEEDLNEPEDNVDQEAPQKADLQAIRDSLLQKENTDFYFYFEIFLFVTDYASWYPKSAILMIPLILKNREEIVRMLYTNGFYDEFIQCLLENHYFFDLIDEVMGRISSEYKIDDYLFHNEYEKNPYSAKKFKKYKEADDEKKSLYYKFCILPRNEWFAKVLIKKYIQYSRLEQTMYEDIRLLIEHEKVDLLNVVLESKIVSNDDRLITSLLNEIISYSSKKLYSPNMYGTIIKLTLQIIAEGINVKDDEGSILLQNAVETEEVEIINAVVSHTTDLRFEDFIQPIDEAISRNLIDSAIHMLRNIPVSSIHHVRYMIEIGDALVDKHSWFCESCEGIYNDLLDIITRDERDVYRSVPYELLSLALVAKWNELVKALVMSIHNLDSTYNKTYPLFIAIQTGNWEIVNLLIEYGISVDKTVNRTTSLTLALKHEAPDYIVTKLLESSRDPNKLVNAGYPSPLQIIIGLKDEKKARICLEYGPDVEDVWGGHAILTIAIQEKWSSDFVTTLIKLTKDHRIFYFFDGPNEKPEVTPLAMAARMGKLNYVKLILEMLGDFDRENAIKEAIINRKDGVASYMWSADVEYRSRRELESVIDAALSGKLMKTSKKFITSLPRYSDFQLNDSLLYTDRIPRLPPPVVIVKIEHLLFASIRHKFPSYTRELLMNDVNVSILNDQNLTPLVYAVSCNNVHAVKLLLTYMEKNLGKGSPDYDKLLNHITPLGTALTLSIEMGQKQITRQLIRAGVNINLSFGGHTPLYLAVSKKWGDVSSEIKRLGANVQEASLYELFRDSIVFEDLEAVSICVNCDATVIEKLDFHSLLAETFLPNSTRYKILELLFKNMINVCDYDKEGLTPLSKVLMAGHETLACILIDKGANINHRNPQPRYSQILLALNNHLFKAASLMIKKGADLSCKNDDGENALMLAIKRKNIELIRAILERGVDPLETNNKDQNAFDYAGDNEPIVGLLNEFMQN